MHIFLALSADQKAWCSTIQAIATVLAEVRAGPRLRQPATSTLFREKHSLLRGFPSKLSPGCAVRRTSI